MKKLIIALAILAVGAAFAEDAEYSITLSATTSTAILPPRDNKKNYEGLWTTNSVVTNGEIFRVLSTKEDYMVLTGGTTSTSNYPSGTSGQVETSGSCTAIHCNYLAPRSAAFVGQEEDAGLWYHTGKTATTNGGQYAAFQAQQFRTDEQGAVSVISDTAVKLNIVDK